MIESRLQLAEERLPIPAVEFSTIEERVQMQRERIPRHKFHRTLAIAIVCVVLLCCTATAAVTDVHYSAWATDGISIQRIGNKLGIEIPKSLDSSPVYETTTMHVVPEGTTYLEAIITPVYQWYAIDYGVRRTVREYHSEEAGSGTSITTETYDEFSLSVGSTENELWKYCFDLNDEGIWNPDTQPLTYKTEQYNGITLQIGTTALYDTENSVDILGYHHKVIWVDTYNRAVFVLRKYLPNDANAQKIPAELLRSAREIVDMNYR